MEVEDRESTDSGSLSGNPESESPPLSGGGVYADHDGGAGGGGGVGPGMINMNISMDSSAAGINSPAVGVGGGVIGSGGVIGGGVIDSGGGGVLGGAAVGVRVGGNGDLSMGKKKRGRPRKYDADGNLNPAYIKSPSVAAAAPQPGFTLSTPPSYEHSAGSKRGRGKHSGPGSSTWLLASLGELFSNTAGGDFTPHVVTVHTGEDVAGKILTFAQKGHRGICVLSANGSVSNVTLRQPGTSGGLLTYEGRFEILTLTGSYTISDNGGMKSRSGGLSVSLASPDGRVIGGGVAGSLTAANPIQIVVGSFVPNGLPVQKRKYTRSEPRPAPAIVHQCAPATVTAAMPLSQAPPETTTNIYPVQTSQFVVQNQVEADNNSLSNKDLHNSASTDTADWNGSGPGSDQRPSPDINISLPFEEH
ncbi:putative DNA-binding protein escarola [Phtheirospermum japonicum]|uniref:AT-hook motif nuclear-localized protein n=1 Tax=Phtheirospermum japonicum TaxID=374723 RepID=A0A830BMQ4_9LAMI|nr:putative DNA-binding protein escarola [Phtheirospermum japonicum]